MTTTATPKETTALLKKYLKQKYGIACSVSSSHYTGGSSIRVEYLFGPAERVVTEEIKRLEYGYVNGYEEIYEYKEDAETGIVLDGKRLSEYKYVFVKQVIPSTFLFELAKFFCTKHQFEEIHDVVTEEDFYRNFSKTFVGCWNWNNLIHHFFKFTNFATQDHSKIELLDIQPASSGCWAYKLIYRFDGKIYDTETLVAHKPKIKKASRPEVNQVKMIDYSEKAIAVIGDSTEIYDELKELRGVWNRNLTVDGERTKGWLFPKSKESQVSDILIRYAQAA